MPSGGHNRKTAKELAQAATQRSDRVLSVDAGNAKHLTDLLRSWVVVANQALDELAGEGRVSIVNAGDQLQKHPAVTVLESASKRIETLVLMVERVEPSGHGVDGDVPEPPRTWVPEVVDGDA